MSIAKILILSLMAIAYMAMGSAVVVLYKSLKDEPITITVDQCDHSKTQIICTGHRK